MGLRHLLKPRREVLMTAILPGSGRRVVRGDWVRLDRVWAVSLVSLGAVAVTSACGIVTSLDDPDPLPLPGCEVIEELVADFGGIGGEQITVLSALGGAEARDHADSYALFESCTATSVRMETSSSFAADIVERAGTDEAPDIAYFPQPSVLADLARDARAPLPLPEQALAQVQEWFPESWSRYGEVDDVQYGVPVDASAKSVVWYAPGRFEQADYAVPQTWQDMMALTRRAASEHPSSKPWCAGSADGEASGWILTDWLEDALLRVAGRSFYDRWVAHDVPFDHPKVVRSLDLVGEILKDPAFVNGGFGGVRSIVETNVGVAGTPVIDGRCWMLRGGTSYEANLARAAKVADDGDIFGFYLPVLTEDGDRPVLAGGNFAARFSASDAAAAFLTYLASPEWANERAAVSGVGWLSVNTGLDVSQLLSPVDQVAAEVLQDEETVVSFDGSDLMPPEVGTRSFPQQMTDWVSKDTPSRAVLRAIEDSWPQTREGEPNS